MWVRLFIIRYQGRRTGNKSGGGGGGGGGGGLRPLTMTTVKLWAYAHGPPRRVGGHAPESPRKVWKSAFLIHSGSSFWTDLVAIFTRALFYKHVE